MPGERSKSWSWVEAGLIPVVSAAMYASWIAPLNQLVLGSVLLYPRSIVYPAWLVIALLVAGALLRRVAEGHPAGGVIVAAVSLVVIAGVCAWLCAPGDVTQPGSPGTLLTSLVDFRRGLPASLWVLLLTGLLWRQGLATDWGEYTAFWRGFVLGALAQVALLLVAAGAHGGPGWGLWRWPVLFLFSGLLGLALLAVTRTLAYESSRGLRIPALNRYWLVAVATVVVGALLGGWLLGSLLTPNAVASALGLVRSVLGRIMDWLEPIFLFIFMLIFRLLGPLFRMLEGREPVTQEGQGFAWDELLEPEAEVAETPRWVQWLGDAFRVLLPLLLGIGVLVLIAAAWRRRGRRQRRLFFEEEREFIWSRELILDQLRQLFRKRSGGQRDGEEYLPLDAHDPREAVRLHYQRLLIRASACGWPRSRQTTPLAYGHLLASRLPTAEPALATLTRIYLLARYGAEAPSWQQVQEAGQALASIEAALDQQEASPLA